LAYNLKDLNKITIRNLINLFKDLRGILKSIKDNIINEGGINKKSLK
jgi:hypothetical protein